jgi:hypothetical protein
MILNIFVSIATTFPLGFSVDSTFGTAIVSVEAK